MTLEKRLRGVEALIHNGHKDGLRKAYDSRDEVKFYFYAFEYVSDLHIKLEHKLDHYDRLVKAYHKGEYIK